MPFPTFHSANPYFLQNYGPAGVSAGVSGTLPLAKWIVISPSLTYIFFPFDRYIPTTFQGLQTIKSVSGDALQQTRLELAIRLIQPLDSNEVRLFLQLGEGFFLESTGKISLVWQTETSWTYPTQIGPSSRYYWGYAITGGTLYRPSRHVNIEASIDLRSNNDDRIYGLVNMTVLYVFQL